MKRRTLNELRQVKTYGYNPPSPSKEKELKQKEKETLKIKTNGKRINYIEVIKIFGLREYVVD